MKEKIGAFTLAEVLTTLVVVGIIAVVTIPILNSITSTQVLEKQEKVFYKKFQEGMHQMQIYGEPIKQSGRVDGLSIKDTDLGTTIMGTSSSIGFWTTSETDNNYAIVRVFQKNSTNGVSQPRNQAHKAFCTGTTD